MRRAAAIAALLLLATFATADDTCDISLQPAATLLLPYFEVDLLAAPGQGETTLFTVINTSDAEQIAHVTLWTDWAYPALDFDIRLTGYDVQSINLYDVLHGRIVSPHCSATAPDLPVEVVTRIRQAFVTGRGLDACELVGGTHRNAIGYATIDVVASCTTLNATSPAYHTDVLRFDNVLAGDYQQVDGSQDYAQSSPLVHIRATPDPLERTFYGRYQPTGAKHDRRQPLPSVFATRWIDDGRGEVQTDFKIWREGVTGIGSSCNQYAENGRLVALEFAIFDEEANAETKVIERSWYGPEIFSPLTPAAFRVNVNDHQLFPGFEDEFAGWMYLNLSSEAWGEGKVTRQAWVVSSQRAEGRYSTDVDAIALGNGCAPVVGFSEIDYDYDTIIGPAEDEPGCDIALLPAATLLLPYFEVDVAAAPGKGQTTLFTIANVSNRNQVAKVTLWTDYGYPVMAFNIFLVGYDIQSINLYDVLALGQIAPPRGTGWMVNGSPWGEFSIRNPAVHRETCRNLPMQLDRAYTTRLQRAFTRGEIAECDAIGGVHANAVGYATIDVTSACGVLDPQDPAYYVYELAFENVLIGDYQQIDPISGGAGGGPMVHIRAVSEEQSAKLGRTFYARHQNDPRDRRQPLPTAFAARWISSEFATDYKVWREGITGTNPGCADYADNGSMEVGTILRFDEDENFVAARGAPHLGATSRVSIDDDDVFPDMNGLAGWTLLDLDRQAWVITSMRAAGRFSVDHDAVALGNGCSTF